MSLSANRNKVLAIGAWMLSLIGGFMAGVGGGVILVSRIIIDRIISLNSNLTINTIAYGDLQTYGAILIIIGLVFAVMGLYVVGRIKKSDSLPPPPS